MKKTKIAAVLAGMMFFTMLAGCGSTSDGNAKVVKDMQKHYDQYVKLGDYSNLTYTPTHTEVTDSDIQSDIDNLVSQNSKEIHITDRAATYGDAVNIDYTGYVDGTAFDNGSTNGAGTQITLGSSGYIDGFDEQIVGHTPGDTFDVNVTFPKDYGVDNLNGKDARFDTTLNYIVQTDKATYDDALVASATDYQTTAEYEKAMREKHEKENKENDQKTDEQSLLQKVIDLATITDYPEEEVKERTDSVINSTKETAEANNVDLSTLLSYYGYTTDTFQSEVQKSVENYVREKMVVTKLAEEVGLTATEKEKNAKVDDLLKQTGLSSVDDLNSQYNYKDEDYYFMVLEDKVIDYLYSHAKAASATDAETATDADSTASGGNASAGNATWSE